MGRIKRVQRGERVEADHINALAEAIEARTPLSFHNALLTQTPHGFHVRSKYAAAVASSPAAAVEHPFKFTVRPKPGPPGFFEGKVTLNSSLYLSLRPNHKQAITGLDAWFDVIANDAVWLGVVFDGSGVPTFVQIDSWGQGDDFDVSAEAWSGSNGYCEDDGASENPVHQASRKLIAFTVANDDGDPVPTQVMFRDQILRNMNIDGRPARYMVDHEGGYPL